MVAVMLTVPLAAVTVASSVNVTMPPGRQRRQRQTGLELGDGRTARAHRATAGGAGEGRLLPAPPRRRRVTTAPSAALAPTLVTTIVYLVDPAGRDAVGAVGHRQAEIHGRANTVGVGCAVVRGRWINDACRRGHRRDVRDVAARGRDRRPIVSVTLPPNGNAGMASPASTWATVGLAGQVAPPAAVQTTVVFVSPAAAGSVTIAPFAASGPALLTTTV